VTPGIPGDSGSGVLNAAGQAIGVLSTVALAPLPLSNGVGDLAKELEYARQRFPRPDARQRHDPVSGRPARRDPRRRLRPARGAAPSGA
jgi:hypothetical protein